MADGSQHMPRETVRTAHHRRMDAVVLHARRRFRVGNLDATVPNHRLPTSYMLSNGVAQCVELLGLPQDPLHASACAQMEAWEAARPDELCLAVAGLVATEGLEGVVLGTVMRQLAAIALKNILTRRWATLSASTVANVRQAALAALRSENSYARAGGAALVEACASSEWPGLAEQLASLCAEGAADGALRAMELLGDRLEPALGSTCASLFGHEAAEIRRRAVRCARLGGWASAEQAEVVVVKLASVAADSDAGVRAETLACLTAAAPRLENAALEAVASHALVSISDVDATVGLRATEWWRALARGKKFSVRFLPEVVPALIDAVRYTPDDIRCLEADSANSTIDLPDRPEDVRPRSDDTASYSSEDDDDDVETVDFEAASSSRSWTKRKSAAATLDALARLFGSLLLDAALPRIAADLDLGTADWPRCEAALLALGAVSDGCRAGLAALADTLAPSVLARLSDPTPQVREISAWVCGQAASKWCFSFSRAGAREHDRPLLDAVLEALCRVLRDDDRKRVLEAATSALSTLFSAAGRRLAPFSPTAAQVLAASFGRLQLRARLEAYDAASALATHVGLDDVSRPALLAALEARWDVETDLDPAAWPFLDCLWAIVRTDLPGSPGAGFYDRALTRCVALVAAACRALQVATDDARRDAALGSLALDILAGLSRALGPSAAVGALDRDDAWLVVGRALSLFEKGPCAHHPARTELRIHSASLASAAAVFLIELAAAAPDAIVDRLPAFGSQLARAVAANAASDTDDGAALKTALDMVAHNASWILAELAAAACDDACSRLAPLVAAVAEVLARRLDDDHHAALVLGRCAARPALLPAVGPHLWNAIKPWLEALGGRADPDSRESPSRPPPTAHPSLARRRPRLLVLGALRPRRGTRSRGPRRAHGRRVLR